MSPKARANQVSKVLSQVLGPNRFPVNVEKLALDYSEATSPDSYIAEIKELDIPSFEGCLKPNRKRTKWLLAYNGSHGSPGRIRFTLAHEFGHFLLHRDQYESFECSERDLYDWDSPIRAIEAEADTFASYLLMPLDDFRAQVNGQDMGLDLLEHCRSRYGVSRMAAALKWVEIAPHRTIVVAARDGFLLWARMNDAAYRSGAVLATRKRTIEVPPRSLLSKLQDDGGFGYRVSDARIWFPREPETMPIQETAIAVDGPYPYVLGILQLPPAEY
ncbi:ImmA/IrrE family metallo-endopeptidase [Marinobacter sp. JSM 1782161]|uniref:ImmA/IrrE family metallo-endopeptidase n=1 Tax=Marinobacter sp. JSM 1782161 TaxID=2685906 RepID=UPI0014040CFD